MKYLVVLFVLLAVPALADLELQYDWSAPTSGSEAVLYHVQSIEDGGEWTYHAAVDTNSMLITVPDSVQAFQLRVAGVDALSRVGEWSDPSAPFSDNGVPGQPGRPGLIHVIIAAGLLLGFLLFGLLRKK